MKENELPVSISPELLTLISDDEDYVDGRWVTPKKEPLKPEKRSPVDFRKGRRLKLKKHLAEATSDS